MNNPGFKVRLIRFLFLGSTAVAGSAMAESPDVGAPRNRTRPQIIYHLPPNYAAMLHSQAKNQNNEFPNENSAPNAPQNSRPALNATPQPAPPSFREQRVKPKLKESRSQGRLHSSAKSPGHGNPHGNKSHKK